MDKLEYKSLTKTPIDPAAFSGQADGVYAVDFGEAWFGTLRVCIDSPSEARAVTVRLGEVLDRNGRIERVPPGEARFREIGLPLRGGRHCYDLVIPGAPKNTGPRTIKMPADVGEVLPFRYVEIEGAPGALTADDIRLVAVHYPFDENASDFDSSDECLNRIWDLCKHTMVATSFCGMFIDGDRERYPREADAYINQLGYYCVDAEYGLARRTHEFMLHHTSRWTEWLFHSIFMAWADLLYTSDDASIRTYYEDLRAKLLLPLARDDGLISVTAQPLSEDLFRTIYRLEGEHVRGGSELVDIVDWPKGERDGYDSRDYNTVVNAFHYRALALMSRMAAAIGKSADAAHYRQCADRVRRSFQRVFLDEITGLYRDGEASTHSSLHANMFPLAFDLVPPSHKAAVLRFVMRKGMACSVYAAQYLLEALFREGQADYAMALMTADNDRSWKHMLDMGATITYEAWDVKYKPNMDQNHAWGAAPANILPRYLLGVQPLTPGADTVVIAPSPGSLRYVRGKVPTRHGPVFVDYDATDPKGARLRAVVPGGVTAKVAFGGRTTRNVCAGAHEFLAERDSVGERQPGS